MARSRRIFGPLFYVTLAIGIVGTLFAAWLQFKTRTSAWAEPQRINPQERVAAIGPRVTSGESADRVEAIHALREALREFLPTGEGREAHDKAVALLREALHEPDPFVATAAADVLGDLGESARPAVDDLVATLQSEDPELQAAAAKALLRFGGDLQQTAIRTLAMTLAEPRPILNRQSLVEALRTAGVPGEDAAIQALVSLLANDDNGVRKDAASCFPLLATATARILPALDPLLHSPKPDVRNDAALAEIQLLDPETNPSTLVATILADRVCDPSRALKQRTDALSALYGFDVESVFGGMGTTNVEFPAGSPKPAALRRCGLELARQLADEDVDVRQAAATLLHGIDAESLAGVDDETPP